MPTAFVFSQDAPTRDALTAALNGSGIATVATSEREEALRCLTRVRVDLVLIDTLCDSARTLCREVRALSGPIPVLYIAGRYAASSPVALTPSASAGAVICRPVDFSEIISAVKAALGLDVPVAEGPVTFGQLTIDVDSRTLAVGDAHVELTPTESRIFLCLVAGEGAVVPTNFLFRCVWGTDPGPGAGDVVRSHIRNIRRKLRTATGRDDWLVTAPRRGYRLAAG